MRILQRNGTFFFLVTLLAAFCGDIFGYFLFDQLPISFLLIFFAIKLTSPLSFTQIALFLFFLSLESFFFYGHAGLYLIYLIPLVIMATRTRDRFWNPTAFSLVILLLALFGQLVIIDYYLLDISPFSRFTLLKLFINIVVTILLSIT